MRMCQIILKFFIRRNGVRNFLYDSYFTSRKNSYRKPHILLNIFLFLIFIKEICMDGNDHKKWS